MKLILKEDITNLGYKDDVVEVKNGYGRNYLIPYGKAILATPSALKVLAENKRQQAHKQAKIQADAEAAAAGLQGIRLEIKAKVSETGTIYGSVSNVQIAAELDKLGHQVDRKSIILSEPVKHVGEYVATVRIYRDVTAQIPFTVIDENAPAVDEATAAPAEPVAEQPAEPIEEQTAE